MSRNGGGRSHISVMTVLPRSAFSWHECGCLCDSCVNNNSLHLHREIEVLRQQVLDRDYHIVQMETRVLSEAQLFPPGGAAPGPDQALRDELRFWQDKYNRLLESHRKLQKVNQSLEDKLLKIVDKYETEKNSLTRDIADLSSKLVSARYSIAELEEESEQYRNDCNVAVHLLRCKPSNFVAHKIKSLPCDLQEKVVGHIRCRGTNQQPQSGLDGSHPPVQEQKTIRVPIPTFPPTAMVYSVSKIPQDTKNEPSERPPDLVSAAIMAKVLEERARERSQRRRDCSCHSSGRESGFPLHKATQTKTLCCSVHQSGNGARTRSESSSSTESASSYMPIRHNSNTSTETII